jgi:hypothetical protein
MIDNYSHVTPGMQEVAAMRFDELVGNTAKTNNNSRI